MKLLKFPNYFQTYNYDCGAQALNAVFVYYGIEVHEGQIMKEAHTGSRYGTPITGIVETAQKHGLTVVSETMDIPKIIEYIQNDIPVIVLLQAWTEREQVNREKNRRNGHYVVVIGYDDKTLYFEDPWIPSRAYLSHEEFLIRRHDKDTKTKYTHHGIAIFGKKPQYDPEKIIHMD